MTNTSELLVIMALVRKLGGEVELTDKDLMEAEEFELQRHEPVGFDRGIRYRVRKAPITIPGDVVAESREVESL